jgi:Concanavalin A-like lectin/glucanases superfamily
MFQGSNSALSRRSATALQSGWGWGANVMGHSNTIISNGLVGYWTFDGGSIDWHTNTVRDMSGQGNTGSLALMSTSSSPVGGKIGQAFNFLGSNTNYVSMGDVLHQSGAFTYSAWIYQTNQNPIDGAPTIMSKYESSDFETWWGFAGNGTALELEVTSADGSSWIGRRYTGALAPNTRYHVAATYDGGTTASAAKIFVNGKRVDDLDVGTGTFVSPRVSTAPFSVGATGDGFYPFAGKIDDARVYNRALSATEVKQLYNAGR